MLHVIDFDQLKIENQQYLEKIEERNNELLRLKLTTGKTVQVVPWVASSSLQCESVCVGTTRCGCECGTLTWHSLVVVRQVLNNLKKKLGNLTAQSDFLRKETAERREQLANFQENLARVTEERMQAQKMNRALKHEQEDTEQPQVLDYMKLKNEVLELQKKEEDWLRKIEIGESVLAGLKKSLRRSQVRGLPAMGATGSTVG